MRRNGGEVASGTLHQFCCDECGQMAPGRFSEAEAFEMAKVMGFALYGQGPTQQDAQRNCRMMCVDCRIKDTGAGGV